MKNKNIRITLNLTRNSDPTPPISGKNSFWKVLDVSDGAQIEQKEGRIYKYFEIVLHRKISEKIRNIGICPNKSKEQVWVKEIIRKTIDQKVQWWNGVQINVVENSISYGSISFIIEFMGDKILPEIFEYSLEGCKLLIDSCLTDTFFESIGIDGPSGYNSNWILEPNDEFKASFWAIPSQNEQNGDAQIPLQQQPAQPLQQSPTPGTNLSSSGSGAIQIINDFSSGLPGSSVAMMRGNEASEKNRPAATAVAERILPDAKATVRAIGGIDPLKALALIVTILSIVVSSLIVMEYNAEKHRYLEMEKALLERYETLISKYNDLLQNRSTSE
jgi:hypothetical protein